MGEKDKKIEELKKKIETEKRKKIKFLLFFILLCLFIYSFFFLKNKTLKYLWSLELFKIKEIKIYPENVSSFIKSFVELEKDKNLLFIDAENLKEKINSIPDVESCKILKIYPSTLQIEIILRKPWALLKYNNQEYLIDREGVIITEKKEGFLFEIYGIKPDKEKNKVQEIEKINILTEFEKWYNHFNVGNHFKIKKIDITDLYKIEISDGERKLFFTPEDLKGKIEKLSFILKSLKDDFEYIDTRFKNFYIKFKNERKNNHGD